MVMKYLERKSRGDVYRNVKKIIYDAIAVIPWMTQDILKCAAKRHRQNISNNQLLDKEESETDKSEHQTSVLGGAPLLPSMVEYQKVRHAETKN